MSLKGPHRPAPFRSVPEPVPVQNAVPENAIDYEEVFRRGGANHGDEDFALCKCPHCGQVYLLEYEVDTLYLDATDLSRRAEVSAYPRDFACIACDKRFPETAAWIGLKAPPEMQVTWDDLAASAWRWVCVRTRNTFG